MEPGQEISVELERGKTLIVRYVTRSEPHEDGTRTVFFELNGQPRSVRVQRPQPGRQAAAAAKGRARQPTHIGAPMPGTVATVSVAVGRKVTRGEVVVTLEAMKMETAVRAEMRRRGGGSAGAARASRWMPRTAGGVELVAATMTEIAARAGAPIGSLYQFFPSKEAPADTLVQTTFEVDTRTLVEALFGVLRGHPQERAATMPLAGADG